MIYLFTITNNWTSQGSYFYQDGAIILINDIYECFILDASMDQIPSDISYDIPEHTPFNITLPEENWISEFEIVRDLILDSLFEISINKLLV